MINDKLKLNYNIYFNNILIIFNTKRITIIWYKLIINIKCIIIINKLKMIINIKCIIIMDKLKMIINIKCIIIIYKLKLINHLHKK